MSLAFAKDAQANAKPDKATIQRLLDENSQLIKLIMRYQSMGRANDALQYQQLLHRNLVYLASLADANVQQQLQYQQLLHRNLVYLASLADANVQQQLQL
ncbi:unnamed protein product [Gongylonema pulchrum]|uniref:GRF1-interacting factor 2 n=1 Tax=Gongylonema pulchrum TaxID=637853 RepID=A0A183DX73_9BILA|nr:unnamed protein product [Gongylonema pulchrum]